MDDAAHLVSIITVVRNAARQLADTIESVRRQTYPSVEYIVVDGASTDATADVLRRNLPNITRPYMSPVGIVGAAIAGVIALVSLVSLYSNEDYRPAVYGTLIYFVLGILYFAIAGRHRLVLSPEEEFALTKGQSGVPGQDSFVASQAEQSAILRGGEGGTTPPPATPPS